MTPYLLSHIDGLITLTLGIVAFGYAYWPSIVGGGGARNRAVRVGAPILLVIGLLRFLTAGEATEMWRWHSTDDGIARAEFPCSPERREQGVTDPSTGIRVVTVTRAASVPFKNIALRLSASPLSQETKDTSLSDRFAELKQLMVEQGFAIRKEHSLALDNYPGCYLEVEKGDGKERCWIRIGWSDQHMYRAVVVSAGSYHNDPLIARFLNSFHMLPSGR